MGNYPSLEDAIHEIDQGIQADARPSICTLNNRHKLHCQIKSNNVSLVHIKNRHACSRKKKRRRFKKNKKQKK